MRCQSIRHDVDAMACVSNATVHLTLPSSRCCQTEQNWCAHKPTVVLIMSDSPVPLISGKDSERLTRTMRPEQKAQGWLIQACTRMLGAFFCPKRLSTASLVTISCISRLPAQKLVGDNALCVLITSGCTSIISALPWRAYIRPAKRPSSHLSLAIGHQPAEMVSPAATWSQHILSHTIVPTVLSFVEGMQGTFCKKRNVWQHRNALTIFPIWEVETITILLALSIGMHERGYILNSNQRSAWVDSYFCALFEHHQWHVFAAFSFNFEYILSQIFCSKIYPLSPLIISFSSGVTFWPRRNNSLWQLPCTCRNWRFKLRAGIRFCTWVELKRHAHSTKAIRVKRRLVQPMLFLNPGLKKSNWWEISATKKKKIK